MTKVEFSGPILFLSADPDKVVAQLDGGTLSLADAGPLRDDVSTDEITSNTAMTYYDDRLARYVYAGFSAGGRNPIGIDRVKRGGFSMTVAGKRYGKGSSREHSVAAERAAGIRLVIAESFERIYRQNADNVGLLTSTDFGLIERIQRGEAIDIEEIVAPRDTLSAAIIRAGGLLRYGAQKMRNVQTPPLTSSDAGKPMTLAEKILSRHLVRTADTTGTLRHGEGEFVRPDWRFIIEVYTGMAAHMLHSTFGNPVSINDPGSVIAFAEHYSYIKKSPSHIAENLVAGVGLVHEAHEAFVAEYGLRSHGFLADGDGSEAICHPMMAERYALPGQVVVGTDSHTPHTGALGCLAFGVGTTEMANALLTGIVRITTPATLKVEFNGALRPGMTAKDLILHLLANPKVKQGAGVGKVFEFGGPVVSAMSTDERTTLTNMAAELGGFSGIVTPDAETVRFLRERRNVEFRIEPWMKSDKDASYADVITIECSALSPMVATPGDPGNGVALAELDAPVPIDIAYGGTCTGGKRADFDHYHEVLSWAIAHRLSIPNHVKLFLQFGSSAVRDYCEARGYLDVFEKVGATLLQPSCGACANLGPGASTKPGNVTVSAQNRNFPGRSGPGQIWLASPPTVVASAIAGELMSFDQLRQRFAATSAQ